MELGMLDAAGHAFVTILDPYRLLMLFSGVIMGLIIGIIPGVGGLAGLALLLPFTFSMDPYAAFTSRPCSK
jgi:TctA family transporter